MELIRVVTLVDCKSPLAAWYQLEILNTVPVAVAIARGDGLSLIAARNTVALRPKRLNVCYYCNRFSLKFPRGKGLGNFFVLELKIIFLRALIMPLDEKTGMLKVKFDLSFDFLRVVEKLDNLLAEAVPASP